MFFKLFWRSWVHLLAYWAAAAWFFDWSNLINTAGLDNWTTLGLVNCEYMIMDTHMFNTFWVSMIFPFGTSWFLHTGFIQAWTFISGGDTRLTIKESAMRTFAAVIGLVARALCTYIVTDLATAESVLNAVGKLMFKHLVGTYVFMEVGLRSVSADFWILIHAVWTIRMAVTENLIIERAECYTFRTALVLDLEFHFVLGSVTFDSWALNNFTHSLSWSNTLTCHTCSLVPTFTNLAAYVVFEATSISAGSDVGKVHWWCG